MKHPLHILHLEDNPADAELIQALLTEEGLECEAARVETREEFVAAVESGEFDLILADYNLPSFDSISALSIAKEKCPDVPFVFVSGTIGEEFAIETLKLGATDYVLKQRLSRLAPAIRRALREAQEKAERRAAQEMLRDRERQQAVVARLGQRALAGTDLSRLFDEAVTRTAETLRVKYCKVLELAQDGTTLLLRAGVGWNEGLVGRAKLNAGTDSQAGYTLRSNGPVVVEDLRTETRFSGPPLLHDHQVISGMSVVIQGPGRPFGVLGAHCIRRRTFTQDDVYFLQSVANVLATAIERRTLEAQLLQAQKLESLGTLTGGIAHDFNNMLTGIMGFTQLLMESAEPGTEVYQTLERVETLSQKAADMVRQLLAFSRKDVGERQGLALHPFLKETGKLLDRVITENIKIDLKLAREDLMVEVDPTQLHQVIMNLLVNARDAMPQGGHVTIETTRIEPDEMLLHRHPNLRPGGHVRLSVKDTGTGIAPEICARIFDPFFTTKELGQGTGLGLSVVYGIVRNHGGAVEVESDIGRGTTFHLYLPLTEKPVVAEPPVQAAAPTGEEMILLVEDEDMVLEVCQTALERLGYQVLTAHDGQEALEVYRDRRDEIALVIMDMVMPRMGGLEAFKALKRLNPKVKVMLATGYSSTQASYEELVKEGLCGLVSKPIHIRKFAEQVRAALGG